MKIRILGSAAGGGFPQWNCNCFNCRGVRDGSIRATARTQSSIAVSENGEDWVLVNASPDILSQIRATPALQPARTLRDSGICAVLLMDAQIDHVTGLLMLRVLQKFENEAHSQTHKKHRDLARVNIFDYIEGFYNRTKGQRHLGHVAPNAFERTSM